MYFDAGLPGFGSGTYWNLVYGPASWSPGTYSSSGGYTDDGGTDSGISWRVSTAGSWSQTTGSILPLLDSYAISYGTQSFTFNLPNGRYNVALISCNGYEAVTSTNTAAAFTINGVTKVAVPTQHTSFQEGNNYVLFSNVMVTTNKLAGTWSVTNGKSFGALNGAQLIYLGPAIQPVTLGASVSSGQMTLTWPSTGWTLQVQTNSVSQGMRTNWVTVPNSSSTNQMTFPVSQSAGCIFYRLVTP
jgi:hypothetical protein